MKVRILQENLGKALRFLKNGTKRRASKGDVLLNVLIETDGGRIKMSTTDLDVALICWVNGIVDTPGSIAVPVHDLELTTKELSGVLSLEASATEITVNNVVMNGVNAYTFPDINIFTVGENSEIRGESLKGSSTVTVGTSVIELPVRATRILKKLVKNDDVVQVLFSAVRNQIVFSVNNTVLFVQLEDKNTDNG